HTSSPGEGRGRYWPVAQKQNLVQLRGHARSVDGRRDGERALGGAFAQKWARSALEAFRHDVDLPRGRTRSGRLADRDLAKGSSQLLDIGTTADALEHLRDEVAAPGLEHTPGEIERQLHEINGGSLIGG